MFTTFNRKAEAKKKMKNVIDGKCDRKRKLSAIIIKAINKLLNG